MPIIKHKKKVPAFNGIEIVTVCPTCKGTGRHLPEQTCPTCNGTGK